MWTKDKEMKQLTFEEWYDINEDEINIELAENGADHEGDFNPELEFEERYQKYCDETDKTFPIS